MQLLIRADASPQIATGHVMRCLALTQAWIKQGGQAIALMTKTTPALESRLTLEGIQILHLKSSAGSWEDAQETVQTAQQTGVTWVVLDGYHFDTEYQRILKANGARLLVLDDYGHAEHYWADIVLNQNISADIGLYPNREAYTQLLLGPSYSLLRQDFWDWQGWQRQIPEIASKILVTLGGADPDNITLKVIQALQQVQNEGLQIVVVVGASNPHFEVLQEVVKKSRHSIRLERNAVNMPELMAWADIAIAGGGSTCWELAFMGLPSLVLILAENQRASAEKLHDLGVSPSLGWSKALESATIAEAITHLLKSEHARQRMNQLGKSLVDGQGGERVLMALNQSPLRVRSVRTEDCELIWKWANDPTVRAYSFSSEIISWETHVQWFERQFNNPNCYFFIGLNAQDQPVGQIRFDSLDEAEAQVSISLDLAQRQRGYGQTLIELAVRELFHTTLIQTIHAWIKPDNVASVRVFEKAEFRKISVAQIKGQNAIHYVRTRSSTPQIRHEDEKHDGV